MISVAHQKNPHCKILISLGWGHNDWAYISNDYENQAGLFVPSVVEFLRSNNLDGFDIDDENIGVEGKSGFISQADFDGVIAQLREALDAASREDGKPYYLTITPAGDNDDGGLADTQVDAQNARSFDLINVQSYFDDVWAVEFEKELKSIKYPRKQIGVGISTEGCSPAFPKYKSLAGVFNWTMSADSTCDFKYTLQVAKDVGY